MKNADGVMYIQAGYIKDEEFSNIIYIKSSMEDELLGKIWRSYDFDRADNYIYELQCKLTKACFNRNEEKIRAIQNKIVYSSEGKMLAVRKVSGISHCAGIDKVVWRKDSDKMRAAILLNNGFYEAKPLKQFIFRDSKNGKERQVGIPTIYDRAMQVLYSYALEPIEEAYGDRKSFAFRKGRSPGQAHSHIMYTLAEGNSPEWVLITDVKSYYDTISHDWLLDNICMNKHILKEFLKAGFILNGELFKKDEGISLGCNLSTILGNMTLDGLQKKLYTKQGEVIQDYNNGYCVRFADDIFVSARSEQDARDFLEIIEKFVAERGLKLSKEKTFIVNVKNGFEFLSRFYCKIDGIIRCIPAEKAVNKFLNDVEEIINASKGVWSQTKLIQALNTKISGFATYHKCEESLDVFKHIDVMINAFLLQMMKDIHKNYSIEQLVKRYWKEDSIGRKNFCVPNNSGKCLKNMEDIMLIYERRINTSKNIFLDKDYFTEIDNNKDIQNCVGRYKAVWDAQEGKCFICGKEIKKEQEKTLIFKRTSKDKTIRNMVYVHQYCKDSIVEYVDVKDEELNSINLKNIISEMSNKKKNDKNESKFIKIKAYFHNLRKNKITLSLKDIEKIIGFTLCNSAYKYNSYYTNNKEGMISENWLSQGYKVSKVDLKNQKISFTRFDFRRTKIQIPKYLYRMDLPMEMIEETKKFFLHIQEKYRLK